MKALTTEAASRLEISRKELLDLGLRNPLINHRRRAKQVEVVDERSTEIYRILVTENRKMTFDALPEEKVEELVKKRNGEETGQNAISWEDLLAQPDDGSTEGGIAARYTDTKLQTNLVSAKLQTRLLSIHNDARTYLEEQGVNILFLAVGFLHWYEAPSATEARRAPLVLIPVQLERSSARQRFRLVYTGADIGDNLSLIEKLKAEFSIEMPTVGEADGLDIERYFSEVADAVKGDPRWHVEADEMTLGFFSFGKFLMYKDLALEAWQDGGDGEPNPAADCKGGFSILESLLTGGFREGESAFADDANLDEIVAPSDSLHVKDADSTQMLAILDISTGRNLVLQGPPGTGKSQTITNVIAECVGKGRKVLFVSEKMAALDVVKRRLDEVGLGDAAIELHSHKTNKKRVLAELGRTLELGRPVVEDPGDDLRALTTMRDHLNAYCDAVNQPIGETRTSFIAALGHALKNDPGDLAPLDFGPMSQWTESDYRDARMRVEELEGHLAEAGSPQKNPFYKSRLTEFLPSQRPALLGALEEAEAVINALSSSAGELARSLGLPEAESREEVEEICRAARRAMDAPDLNGLDISSDEWRTRGNDLASLMAAGKALRQAHTRWDRWLIDAAWQQDLVEVRQHYVTKARKWWRFLSGDFRRSKARLQGLCRKPLPEDTTKIITMIDAVLNSRKHWERFQELSPLGASLLGPRWKKEASDWDQLDRLREWVAGLFADVEKGELPEGIVGYLGGAPRVDELKKKVEEVETRLHQYERCTGTVTRLLKLDDGAGDPWDLSLDQQCISLIHWRKNIDSLDQRVRFNQLSDEFQKHELEFVVEAVDDWNYPKGALLRIFDYSWFNGLVEKAYVERPSLKRFDRTQQTHVVDSFCRLDHRLFRYNQVRLAAMHWEGLPGLNDGGELQIIKREINKKRRIMPIRRLITEAGRAIQAIKPVFMMSPMSIATYLPPGSVHFDLVIFDEASQVKPVDAFGAIIRGDQTVVVGDSRQLPPTSFFDSLVEGDDQEDFESVGDVESVLSLFAGKGAPERMLRWHYRSRHDSLIAVSNKEFYENRLVVFPSPGVNPTARGLRFHHLPHTVYERGRSRSNPEEAKVVAGAVFEHIKKFPDLTLGVAAFSTAQRDAVELQLELLRHHDPTNEPFFAQDRHEPFFVKNLENVQGDERDVIFISIGYGKNAEGYMTMNFGPVNREGGERRLNVLITRARLAMDVFSNFTADDIDLNRSKARGVVALKNFLAFAQTGVLDQPHSTGKEPDSPFEEAVIEALVQHGIEVEPQVGSAGFFIDIGVKDPKKPGRYILGIECDGATYHSSHSARDRDRLRQEVLEGLGWQLHRIWSTEWYRNPQKELERVLAAIKKADHDSTNPGLVESPKTVPAAPNTPVQRDETSHQDSLSSGTTKTYVRTSLKIPLGDRQLHELKPGELWPFVYQVVEIESPIHGTEIMRRITEGAGLKRMGTRIRHAVEAAIAHGVRQRRIRMKGEFFWRLEMKKAEVRDRSNLDSASKKLEFVPPEEIQTAILEVVERGFSLSSEDAVAGAARAMGFHRLSAHAKTLLDAQLTALVQGGTLVARNGKVSVRNDE